MVVKVKGKLVWTIIAITTVYLVIQITDYVAHSRIIFKKYSESTSATLKVQGNFILGYKAVLIVEGFDYKQKLEIIRFYDTAHDWYKYIESIEWEASKDLHIKLTPNVFSFGKKLYLLEEENIRIGEIGIKIGLPTQSEVEDYERKMSQGSEMHTTYN